jgi:translation initiation factor IF-2
MRPGWTGAQSSSWGADLISEKLPGKVCSNLEGARRRGPRGGQHRGTDAGANPSAAPFFSSVACGASGADTGPLQCVRGAPRPGDRPGRRRRTGRRLRRPGAAAAPPLRGPPPAGRPAGPGRAGTPAPGPLARPGRGAAAPERLLDQEAHPGQGVARRGAPAGADADDDRVVRLDHVRVPGARRPPGASGSTRSTGPGAGPMARGSALSRVSAAT